MQYLIIFCGPNTPSDLSKQILPLQKSLSGIPNSLVVSTGAGEENSPEMNKEIVKRLMGKSANKNMMIAYAGDNTELIRTLGCFMSNMENLYVHQNFANYFANFLKNPHFLQSEKRFQ